VPRHGSADVVEQFKTSVLMCILVLMCIVMAEVVS